MGAGGQDRQAIVACGVAVLLILCGALLGIIALQLTRAHATPQAPLTAGGEPPLASRALYEQLVERVQDASNFINTMVASMGVIFAILAAVMGLSLWQTTRSAGRAIRGQFAAFNETSIQPLLRASHAELTSRSKEGTLVMIEAAGVLQDYLLACAEAGLRAAATTMELYDEEPQRSIEELRARSLDFREVARDLLGMLSLDEAMAYDAAQKIGAALAVEGGDRSGLLLMRAETTRSVLHQAMENWRSGPIRQEIQRALDDFERALRRAPQQET